MDIFQYLSAFSQVTWGDMDEMVGNRQQSAVTQNCVPQPVQEVMSQSLPETNFFNKQLACQFCPLMFSSRSILNVHIDTKHSDRASKCTICSKVFTSRQHLNGHIAAKHDHTRKVVCQFCGKGFSYKHTLKIHQANSCVRLRLSSTLQQE